jgi:hypothetical protein
VIGDGRSCGTGTPQMAARDKDLLFPDVAVHGPNLLYSNFVVLLA